MNRKVVLFSAAAGLAYWCLDAALDTFVLKQGTFPGRLFFAVSRHDVYSRLLVCFCFLLLGLVFSKMIKRRSRTTAYLVRHSAAIETSMDGIAIYNPAGEYLYVNQAYASVNGYDSPSELIGKTCAIAYGEQEYARLNETIMPFLHKSGRWRGELLARRKNGSTYFQEATISMFEDGGRVCIVRDITWRKRSEDRLHRSERFLNTIFNSIRDPFCIFDADFRIIRLNEAYAQMRNKRVEELLGGKCHEVLLGRDIVCEECVVAKTFHSEDPCAKDKLVPQDGAETWMEIYTYPILDDDGTVSHVIEYTRDITDRKKSEVERRRLIDKLDHLSKTDGVTGLMNRRALTDSLYYEIDRAKRYCLELSLLLCDVDNFKLINDTYGHDAGDRVLQTLSGTLRLSLRTIDIAGRYGGDEFMIILPGTTVQGASSLAEKLLVEARTIDLPFKGEEPVRLSLSIGIAGFKKDCDDDTTDSFVKRADDAMYASKQGGKNRVSIVSD